MNLSTSSSSEQRIHRKQHVEKKIVKEIGGKIMKFNRHNKVCSIVLSVCMLCFFIIGNVTPIRAADQLPTEFSQLDGYANYNASTGEITLTDNVTLTSQINIPAGNYTIDLAGYTVNGQFGIYRDGVSITFKDSSPEGTGTIISDQGTTFYVQGQSNTNISIEGGNFICNSPNAGYAVFVKLSFDTGNLSISGGTFISNWVALGLDTLSRPNRFQLTGGYFKTNATAGTNPYSIMDSSSTNINAMIPSQGYVSLNDADAIAIGDATELNAKSYAGTIRIFPSEPPKATPDSTQDATVKAYILDDSKPPVTVPTYTTTIPSTLDLGTLKKSITSDKKTQPFEVSVSEAQNLDGKKVRITLAPKGNGFNLMNGTNALPYQVFNVATGGSALAADDLFAEFADNGTQQGRIEVDQANITASGNYSATLTFTIKLEGTGSGIEDWKPEEW